MAVKVCPTCGGELYQASINGSRLGEVCLSQTCSYEGVLGKVHEAFMARCGQEEKVAEVAEVAR